MQTQVPGASQSQTTLWMAYDGISTSSRPETARVVSPERLDGVKQVCPLFDPKPSSSQKQELQRHSSPGDVHDASRQSSSRPHGLHKNIACRSRIPPRALPAQAKVVCRPNSTSAH